MSGLVNQLSQQTQSKESSKLRFNDPSLQQMAQQITSKIPLTKMAHFLAIENSGMQVIFSKETSHLINKYIKSNDLVGSISNSIAMLLAYIYKESNKKMDISMAGPAGLVLMCHVLDYAEQTGMIQLNPQLIAQCAQATAMASLKVFGIGQAQIDAAIQRGKQAQAQKQNTGATPLPATQGAQ